MPTNTLDKVREFYEVEETGNPVAPYQLKGKRGAVYFLMRSHDGKKVGVDTPMFAVTASGSVTKLRGLGTEWVWDDVAIKQAAPEQAKRAAERIATRKAAAKKRASREKTRKASLDSKQTQDGTAFLKAGGIHDVVATVHSDGIVLDADDPKKLEKAIKFLTDSGKFSVSKHTKKADSDGVFWADLSMGGEQKPAIPPPPASKSPASKSNVSDKGPARKVEPAPKVKFKPTGRTEIAKLKSIAHEHARALYFLAEADESGQKQAGKSWERYSRELGEVLNDKSDNLAEKIGKDEVRKATEAGFWSYMDNEDREKVAESTKKPVQDKGISFKSGKGLAAVEDAPDAPAKGRSGRSTKASVGRKGGATKGVNVKMG